MKLSKNKRNQRVSASKRTNKRSKIMAGAGSGITLEIRSLDFTSAPNSGFYVLDRQEGRIEPEDGVCKGELDIASIGTYYDGGDPRVGDIPVTIQVYDAVFDDSEDLNSGEFKDLTVKELVNDITELEDNKIRIGGGWLRSKFPGTFKCIAYTDYATIDLRVTIDDKELAEWLDEFAHGDNEVIEFDVCINDDPIGNPTESQEDAIATAEKYADDPDYEDDEITVRIQHYQYGYDGDIIDYYNDDGDVVWSSMDDLYN